MTLAISRTRDPVIAGEARLGLTPMRGNRVSTHMHELSLRFVQLQE